MKIFKPSTFFSLHFPFSGNVTVATNSGTAYGGLYQFFVPPGSLSPGIVFVGFHLPGGCRVVVITCAVMQCMLVVAATQQYRTCMSTGFLTHDLE